MFSEKDMKGMQKMMDMDTLMMNPENTLANLDGIVANVLKEKKQCVCGSSILASRYETHLKSKKHMKFVK
jgi:hypothetical protein